MTDEDLLSEALECIYEISGAYMNFKDPAYQRHKEQLKELDRVVKLLEKRLGSRSD